MTRQVQMGVVACAVALLAIGQAQAVTVFLTTRDTSAVTLAGVTFLRGDIVGYDTDAGTASMFFEGKNYFRRSDGTTGAAENIDGLYVYPDGRILLSTDSTTRLGSNVLKFENGDIVLFNMATDTASIYLPGSGASSIFRTSGWNRGAAENVDALHLMSNGNLLLSTNGEARLGANKLLFKPGDIVEYDPVADYASVYFASTLFRKADGTPQGPAAVNVDGVSMFGTSLLLSTADPARLGAPPNMLSFGDGDIVMYNRTTDTAAIFFAESLLQCNARDIDGLSVLYVEGGGGVIPEPLSACGLGLDLLSLGGYLRRRTAAR